jgi:IS6 family transposase
MYFCPLTRELPTARAFFVSVLRAGTVPVEVTTDRATSYPRVMDKLLPQALHTGAQFAHNPVEADTVGSRRDCDRCAG